MSYWKENKILGPISALVILVSLIIIGAYFIKRSIIPKKTKQEIKRIEKMVQEEMQKVYPEPKPKDNSRRK